MVELVGSAGDAKALTIDRVADIQTATFEAFVDIVERSDAARLHLTVTRTSAGLTVRLSAEGSEWSESPSFLAERVVSSLADRAVFEKSSIELEFLG